MKKSQILARHLRYESLEKRELLACNITSALAGTFPGHKFAIVSVSPSATPSVSNETQLFELKGQLSRADGSAFGATNHGDATTLEISAFGSGVTSALVGKPVLADLDTKVTFTLAVTAGLGTRDINFHVKAPGRSAEFDIEKDGAKLIGTLCVNQQPVANPDSGTSSTEDTVNSLAAPGVLANDTDSSVDNGVDFEIGDLSNGIDGVTAVNGLAANVGNSFTLPSGAKLKLKSNGSYDYDPRGAFDQLAAGTSTTDTFEYTISDGFKSATSTVTVTITGVNDVPISVNDVFSTKEEVTLTKNAAEGLLKNDTDPDDGASLSVVLSSISAVDPLTKGALSVNADGSFEFVPVKDFNGVVTFSYLTSDGTAVSTSPAEVTIRVDSVIDAPLITNFTVDTGVPDDKITNAAQISFKGTSEESDAGDPVTIQVFRDDTQALVATAMSDDVGDWISKPLATESFSPDGKFKFYALATDNLGTSLPIESKRFAITFDRTKPRIHSNSIVSELRGSALDTVVQFDFNEPDNTEDVVTGFGIDDLRLTKDGSSTNRLEAAGVSLIAGSAGEYASTYFLTGLDTVTDNSGSYSLSLLSAGTGIEDIAANPIANAFATTFAVDVTPPTAQIPTLTSTVLSSSLPVPVIEASSASGATVSYELKLTEQQFKGFANSVSIRLVDSITGAEYARRERPIPSATSDNLALLLTETFTITLPPGQHSLRFLLVDAAGNNGESPVVQVYVSQNGADTINTPGTPAFSESVFIGSTAMSDFAGSTDFDFSNAAKSITYSFPLSNAIDFNFSHTSTQPALRATALDAAGQTVGVLTSTLRGADESAETVIFDAKAINQKIARVRFERVDGQDILAVNGRVDTSQVSDFRFGDNTILVDRDIPTGFPVNYAGSVNRVAKSVKLGDKYQLTLDRVLAVDVPQGQKISWLRPWQMSFDKTTQTVWFTMEDGDRIGQFDPATGLVQTYDVSIPVPVLDSSGQPVRDAAGALVVRPTAFDPHGVFFDFNSHLTPRIWLVYRNQFETGSVTTPAGGTSEADGVLRMSYFDLAQRKLFTFDFEDIADKIHLSGSHTATGSGGGGGTGTGGGTGGTVTASSDQTPLEVGHAVFVDAKGNVWISAEDSGALVELDFDTPTNSLGGSSATLDGPKALATVHIVPNGFGLSDSDTEVDFHVHGVQVEVDQRNATSANPGFGKTYVWMVNGNSPRDTVSDVGVQRVVLMIPSEAAEPDQWFEITVPRIVGGEEAHLLFTAIDDNETPGIPEDDRLIFSDPGFGFRSAGDGLIVSIDVGPLISRIQSGLKANSQKVDDITLNAFSVQIPRIPGAASTAYAGPNQAFVDRSGVVFAVDPQGAISRLSMKELFAGTVSGVVKEAFSSTTKGIAQVPQKANIRIQNAATSLTVIQESFLAEAASGSHLTVGVDRSQADAVDQYEVAEIVQRRNNGEGPFRGALNASNVIYTSLSQSDHLATTVFAESARRQMTAVSSPFPAPAGAIVEARMAFQVVRDGSVLLTARGDGMIRDQQVNLLSSLFDAGKFSSSDLQKLTIVGEVGSSVGDDNKVYVMGRSAMGGVVVYTFTPYGSDWAQTDLNNPNNWTIQHRPINGHILAEDVSGAGPLGFSATTAAGHWLAIALNGSSFEDLTVKSGDALNARVYSSVGVDEHAGKIYGYGTNQTGNLVEYTITNGNVSSRIINAPSRDTRVLQNVDVLITSDGVRHVFGTDGTSRLVQYEIEANGTVRPPVNVTQLTVDSNETYGYFDFQKPFAGRVYTYVEPIQEADGTIRVYGTNGGDVVEFTKQPTEPWRVANLTQNTNATFGRQAPTSRVPANAVFGAPTAYTDSKGGRHVLQINGEGEVVEYYTYGQASSTVGQLIRSQNINLINGVSPSSLFLSAHPILSKLQTTVVATNALSSSGGEAEDINQDGIVSAVDVLAIVNHINSQTGAGEGEGEAHQNLRLDVSGDGHVTAVDALMVINYINRRNHTTEGEAQREPTTEDAIATNLWSLEEERKRLSILDEFFDSLVSRG